MTILLDVESRSRADLKKVGGRNYWAHPSSEVLCVVSHDADTNTRHEWRRGDPTPPWAGRGRLLGAHNLRGFDRFALARLGWADPEDYDLQVDTSECARTAGLPGALDALGARWLGMHKDKAASRFVKSLSRGSRAKARVGQLPELTAEVLDRTAAYCHSDVDILEHGWPLLESWQHLEPDVLRTDCIINDRGVAFDSQLARRLLEEDSRICGEVLERTAQALDMPVSEVEEIAGSPAQLCAATGLENAQKETIEKFLLTADAGDEFAVRLCLARQALASIARGKLEAGLNTVSADGRIRDSLRYYGAHTGRWSGRGMQLQNMPRPAKRFETWGDTEICEFAEYVLSGGHCDAEEIDLLLRATLHGGAGNALVWQDFSGVEARVLAFCANDLDALDVFASGVSEYKIMAGMLSGQAPESIGKGDPWYTIGKAACLACGYSMGPAKFEWTAASKHGVNLHALGIDPAAVVASWRTLHAPIVRFWRDAQNAFLQAAYGDEAELGAFRFVPSSDGRDVAIFLPSGRPVVYNAVEVHPGQYGPQASYEGAKDARDKDADGKRVGEPKPMRERLYGGLIVENMIQATTRDLLADALVRTERAGLCPVLSVHDEGVCQVPRKAAPDACVYLGQIMGDLPEWAEGWPINAAGDFGERYRK